MAQDADDATSALIAKLLQQDQMAAGNPYFDIDQEDKKKGRHRDGEDDDFAPAIKKKKERAPKPAPAPKPKKRAKADGDADAEKADGEDKSNAGLYTDEEEKKFREGFTQFGRDWGKISEYMGTRDKLSVRSHAQKHFINLLKAGEPLPPKVAESGVGYTLSGKPLNLESGSVKPYLRGVLSSEAFMSRLTHWIESGAVVSIPVVVQKEHEASPVAEKSSNNLSPSQKAEKSKKSVTLRAEEAKSAVSASSLPTTTTPKPLATPTPNITPQNSFTNTSAGSQNSSRAASAAGTPNNTPASNPSTPSNATISPETSANEIICSPNAAPPTATKTNAPALSSPITAAATAASSFQPSIAPSSSSKRSGSKGVVDISAALASAAALTQKLTSAPTTEIRVVRKPRKRKEDDVDDDPEMSISIPQKETKPPRQSRQSLHAEHEHESESNEEEAPVMVSGRTEYSKSRLRENSGKIPSASISAAHIDSTTNPLTMVRCESLSGESAPFRLRVHSNALLLVDLHAHLSSAEIIGFLGGKWDSQNKVIEVLAAFPCRAVEEESASGTGRTNDGMNVEMAPESELAVREQIQKSQLQVVGWYHSHPVFQPDPSLRDIENQHNYQMLFRDQQAKMDPFIGLIVCPYDIRLPTDVSLVNNFLVRPSVASGGTNIPFSVSVDPIADPSYTKDLTDKMDELVDYYSKHSQRVDMAEIWRMCQPLNPNQPQEKVRIDPISRLQKLKASLRSRLPTGLSTQEGDDLLSELCTKITNKWKKE